MGFDDDRVALWNIRRYFTSDGDSGHLQISRSTLTEWRDFKAD